MYYKEPVKYNIMTLSASAVISSCPKHTYDDAPTDEGRQVFFVDLSQPDICRLVVKNVDAQEDNAFFYQAYRAGLASHPKEFAEYSPDMFMRTVFFLDCSDIPLDEGGSADKKAINAEIRSGFMSIIKYGVLISFIGDDERHFCASDKSASMSRASKISFVWDDKIPDDISEGKMVSFRDVLDEYLMLGMNFSEEGKKVPVKLSKYYAYRGLYFTSADRVPVCFSKNGKGLVFNEETVIVVPDDNDDYHAYCARITAEEAEKGSCRWTPIDKPADESKQKSSKMNHFDGEGIICPEYAEMIEDHLLIDRYYADLAFLENEPFRFSSKELTRIYTTIENNLIKETDCSGADSAETVIEENGRLIPSVICTILREKLIPSDGSIPDGSNPFAVLLSPPFSFSDEELLTLAKSCCSGKKDSAAVSDISDINVQRQKSLINAISSVCKDRAPVVSEEQISRIDTSVLIRQLLNWKRIYTLRNISSIQVRMPMVKGMLHSVDFEQCLTEMLELSERFPGSEPESDSNYKEEYKTLKIRDAFGVERELSKVRVILTVSMFKMHKWLKVYCRKNSISDPMKFYFEQLEKYDHALYVANDSSMLTDNGYVTLNYQFLNTLALGVGAAGETGSPLELLFSKHYELCCNEADPDNIRIEPDSVDPGSPGDPDSSENGEKMNDDDSESSEYAVFSGETLLLKKRNKYRQLCRLCPAFKDETTVKGMIDNQKKGMLQGALSGRLYVKGECRFLSRDLFSLLIHIAKKINFLANGEKREIDSSGKKIYIDSPFRTDALKKLRLRTDTAYMASAKDADAARAVLLRSPHLSRNEQCAVDFLDKKTDAGKLYLYEKYFSHLDRVIMLNYSSMNPLALGGADFDGDLVKVVTEQIVVNAVQSSLFCFGGKNRYPIIDIPSTSEDDEYVPEYVKYETVKNTFSSRVGLLSNIAISIGRKVYSTPDSEENTLPAGDSAPDSEENTPPAGDSTPSSEENTLPAGDSAPGSEENTPPAGDSTPGSEENTPPAGDSTHAPSGNKPPIELKHMCPMCTILVGLEIDSAKNGRKPVLTDFYTSLDKYDITHGSDKDPYLKTRKKLLGIIGQYDQHFGSSLHFYYPENRVPEAKRDYRPVFTGRKKLHEQCKYDESNASLDKLPWLYLDAMKRYTEKSAENKAKSLRDLINFPSSEDENIVREFSYIFQAYNSVLAKASKEYRQSLNLEKAKFTERIYVILSQQYDNIYSSHVSDAYEALEDAAAAVSEDSVEDSVYDTLLSTSAYIEAKLPTINEAKKCLEDIIGSCWQYTPFKAREEKLRSFFNESDPADSESVRLSDASVQLLCNFDCAGYRILYYMVKNRLYLLSEGADVSTARECASDKDTSGNSKYKKKYMDIYNRAKTAKKTKTLWNAELIRKCRQDTKEFVQKKIQNIADEEVFIMAIRLYVASRSTSSSFFWDIFTIEEIAAAYEEAQKEKDAPPAVPESVKSDETTITEGQ